MTGVTRSLIVFAGGKASRLGGVSKPLLDVGGTPIIERILSELRPLTDEAIAIVNDDSLTAVAGLRFVHDPDPHAGVLPALAVGLHAAGGDLCLAVAGDMPFASRLVFEALLEQAAEADVVIPRVDGQLEPMHAIYRRVACLQAVEAALLRQERRMIAFHRDVRVHEVDEVGLRRVDPDLLAFFNVNTPGDLEAARDRAMTRRPK